MDPGVSSGKGMESGGRETGKDLNKARLTEFYRIHAPEKVDSVDKVFKLFDGRTDSLNKKLKRKVRRGDILPTSFVVHHPASFTHFVYCDGENSTARASCQAKNRRTNLATSAEGAAPARALTAIPSSTAMMIPSHCRRHILRFRCRADGPREASCWGVNSKTGRYSVSSSTPLQAQMT